MYSLFFLKIAEITSTHFLKHHLLYHKEELIDRLFKKKSLYVSNKVSIYGDER